MAVGQKLDFTDENVIVRAFRFADTSGSGKLDAEEFLVAYDAMFTDALAGSGGDDESFVRAVRYGIDKSKKPAKIVMQQYTGSITEISKFFDLLKNKEKDLKEPGGLETISALILKDNMNNTTHGSNLLWWVDVAVSEIMPNNVNLVIKNFGLPTDIDTCFFNEYLSCERESRVRSGTGKITEPTVTAENYGDVVATSSLTFFIQSMYLTNLPVVYEIGAWVDYLRLLPPLHGTVKYISSRFAQFYDLSGRPDNERTGSLCSVDVSANNFVDIDSIKDIDIENSKVLNSSTKMPAVEPISGRNVAPEYLLSRKDLLQR
jgi:hypothetical protein